jgi:hypothetical protein
LPGTSTTAYFPGVFVANTFGVFVPRVTSHPSLTVAIKAEAQVYNRLARRKILPGTSIIAYLLSEFVTNKLECLSQAKLFRQIKYFSFRPEHIMRN